MATYFSDHFGPQVAAGLATIATPRPKIAWGVDNKWVKRCSIILPLSPTAFTAADIARLMTFKSNDRIYEIFLSASGGTAVAADLGVYLTGANHDGGTPAGTTPLTLFSSAATLAGTIARTGSYWLESAVNVDTDRGQTLWELLALTADTNVQYDLAFTCTTTLTTGAATVTVEAYGSFN